MGASTRNKLITVTDGNSFRVTVHTFIAAREAIARHRATVRWIARAGSRVRIKCDPPTPPLAADVLDSERGT